jgi:hypothetical protein
MSVDETGVVSQDRHPGIIRGGAKGIAFAGGSLYASSGQVVDLDNLVVRGEFDLGLPWYIPGRTAGFAIDTSAKRAYYAIAWTTQNYLTIVAAETVAPHRSVGEVEKVGSAHS